MLNTQKNLMFSLCTLHLTFNIRSNFFNDHDSKGILSLILGLKENMTSLFAKDKQGLAESREHMIDSYLVNLLKQPERVGYRDSEQLSSIININ